MRVWLAVSTLVGAMGCGAAAAPSTPDPGAEDSETESPGDKADNAASTSGWSRGVLPDYAAHGGIYLHNLARDLDDPFVRAVLSAYGARVGLSSMGVNVGESDTSLVWMRDYMPIAIRDADAVRMVQYLSINPRRSEFTWGQRYSAPGYTPPPGKMLYRLPNESVGGHWLQTTTLPLILEGGNVVATEDAVFMTDKVFQDNTTDPQSFPHLAPAGYKARSPDEVRSLLVEALGIEAERLYVMSALPGEKTHHVDLFLMALSKDRVMIPEVRQEAIDQITYEHEIGLARRAQAFLNDRTKQLEDAGYTVDRLPIMPAVFLEQAADRPEGWTGRYFSPTNAALVNIDGAAKAFVPTFEAAGFPDAYRAMNERYIQDWTSYFESNGYEPVPVDATRLGMANGLFRCLSAVLPALE